MRYSYAIIKENYPALDRESTFIPSKWRKTKYALIEKQSFEDGSEGINKIIYSNDLAALSLTAQGYVSWYNYPCNVMKDIQGYIRHIVS